jgi:thiol-disulfide isomerase/thioredoxin
MKEKIIGWIKELFLAAVIVAVLLNIVSFLKRPDLASSSLPDLNFTTTTNKNIEFKNYRSKPLIVHFWATWCPTCKLEIANLDRVAKNYQVITIAVNSGNDKDINRFLKEHKLDFDVINDYSGKIAAKFSVDTFPTTFIYDKDANIKFSEVGYTSTVGLLLRMWLAN